MTDKHNDFSPLPSQQPLIDQAKMKELHSSVQNIVKKLASTAANNPVATCPNPCKADTLTIREQQRPGEAKTRSYALNLTRQKPVMDPDKNPSNRFEVLSVDHFYKEWNATTMELLSTACPQPATPPCGSVLVIGDRVDKTIQPTSGEVKVFAQEPPFGFTDVVLLSPFIADWLFPKDTPPQIYAVKTLGCGQHKPLRAEIAAYPKKGWKGSLEVNLNSSPEDGDEYLNAPGEHTTTPGMCIDGKVGVKLWHCNRESSLKLELPKAQTAKKGLPGLLTKAFWVMEKADFLKRVEQQMNDKLKLMTKSELELVEFSLKWPAFNIDGGMELVEIPDQYMVSTQGGFTCEVNLIGLKAKTDVFDIMAMIYCKQLLDIKKLAAEGKSTPGGQVAIKANLRLELSAECGVSGKVEYKADGTASVVTGAISTFGGMGLKGDISAEGKVFFVVAGAGASAELQSAKSTKEACGFKGTLIAKPAAKVSEGIDWSGQIEFNGLAFYYALYAYAGREEGKTRGQGEGEEGGFGAETGAGTTTLEYKTTKEVKKKIILIDPWQYPES